MKTVASSRLVAAALVVGLVGLTAAGLARLTFLAAVYADNTEAGLHLPQGAAWGPNGLVVVGDTGNDRLVTFTFRDRTLGPASVVKVPQLTEPVRVQVTSKGEIYALDGRQHRIVHLDAGGRFKEFVAYEGAPSPATIVPKSFAIDAADALYVLDEFSGRVLVVNSQGRFERVLPLPTGIGFATDLTVDSLGNLLVLDSVRRRIYQAAKGGGTFAQLGGDLSASVATMPTSIAASKGMIFIVEGNGSTIDIFGRDGRFVTRLLAEGQGEGALDHPGQMGIDDKDEVVVADRDNSRVQIFQLTR